MLLRKLKLFFLKKKIKKLFKENKITIKSVSKNGFIEYKQITDVLKHNSEHKNIHKITLENNKKVITTQDHSVFILNNNEIKPVRTDTYPEKIVFIDKILQEKNIKSNIIVKNLKYTYDLSVKDNENFVLSNGILVHNSFSSPSSEQAIGGFTKTRGYRWGDFQLYSHLMQACNYLNLIPPDTDFSLDNFPVVWQPLLLMQAMSYALWDLAILWINEEFSYSLNGISLDIQRSDKYQSAASSIQDQVNQQTELAKKRLHITKGLAQSKYTFARSAALGPWCVFQETKVFDIDKNEWIRIADAYNNGIKRSYSMNLETNEIIENNVVKVWSNGEQELFELTLTNGYSIISTKTHKYFNESNDEIELQNLNKGDKIWIFDKNLILQEIEKCVFYGKAQTFDMEMNEPYRNYIANNIVVHNTGGANIKRWIMGTNTVRFA